MSCLVVSVCAGLIVPTPITYRADLSLATTFATNRDISFCCFDPLLFVACHRNLLQTPQVWRGGSSMEDDLKRTAWCSLSANAVERDQIDAAVKIAKVNRAKWLRDLAVKEARRILSRTTAKKGGK